MNMHYLYDVQINLLTIVLSIAFSLLFILIWVGAKRKTIDCMDLITSKDGRLDINSIGQCLGVIIATWAPSYTVYIGKLDPIIFTISLTYLAGIKAFASYMRHKDDVAKVSNTSTKGESAQ